MKKLIAMLLALVMCLGMMTACSSGDEGTTEAVTGNFTYNAYTTALGTNWNPHTWETNADDTMLSYLSEGFVDLSIKDSANGVYQWVYGMATSIEDVTASAQDDLTKYAVTLPEGATTADAGYVYEIKLNPEAKWEDGTAINADTYVYSMQQLLAPEMKNYRANLYIAGESAIAGGANYYYQGSSVWMDNSANANYAVTDYVAADGAYTTPNGEPVVIAVAQPLDWLGGDTLQTYVEYYGEAMFDVAAYESLLALCDEEGYAPYNDETIALLTSIITYSADWGETAENVKDYTMYQQTYPEASFDSVGLYKVDDYTIRYVCQTAIEKNYFLTSCTSTWLVYESLYEAGKDTSGELTTTDYGTSLETSISYGPYKMESIQADKQVVFVQNENWYGWEKTEDGSLVSYTNFEVDGAVQQQYQTTKIVIDVMEESGAKQAFLKGELSSWSPNAEELTTYATSDQLYKVDETYTMSFFFNTN
ncbi:MAG: hypothetical protein IJ037_08500, partial [Clostridia bacterium]|nr:hypothetical protein [Clostridia bacterium]